MRHDEGHRGSGNRERSNSGNISEIKSVTLHEKLDAETEGYSWAIPSFLTRATERPVTRIIESRTHGRGSSAAADNWKNQ